MTQLWRAGVKVGVVPEEPLAALQHVVPVHQRQAGRLDPPVDPALARRMQRQRRRHLTAEDKLGHDDLAIGRGQRAGRVTVIARRSEEHTSELQSLMRISYAVFCLKKKTN